MDQALTNGGTDGVSMVARWFWLVFFACSGAVRAAADPIEVPLEVHGTHAYARVTAEKTADIWFLLDSGAATPVNLIDADVAARIGLKAQEEKTGGAIGGKVTVKLSTPAALKIGDVALQPASLAMLPLAGMAADEGHRVDGIL